MVTVTLVTIQVAATLTLLIQKVILWNWKEKTLLHTRICSQQPQNLHMLTTVENLHILTTVENLHTLTTVDNLHILTTVENLHILTTVENLHTLTTVALSESLL